MFDRWTDRARKVMVLAKREADHFKHDHIGTEHILLGLVKEGNGVGAVILKNLDVDIGKLRVEVERLAKSGTSAPAPGKPPYTPRAKKVVRYALEEALALNHNYVGTEHVLLSLLREKEGTAAQMLINLGLKLEDIRQDVLNLLGAATPDSVPEPGGSGMRELCEQASIDLYIDPGEASTETIREVLAALSDLHAAAGGLGLEFKSDGHFVHAVERVSR